MKSDSAPFSIKIWIKNHRWYLLLLALSVFIPYANALGNGFVADDRGILLHIGSWETISANPNTFLRQLLYNSIFFVGGLNPFLFHLPNILLHLGTVWLIFFLLARTSSLAVGLISSILFAVHPILIESVSWISGGVYVQYSFFFLLSFIAYLFWKESRKGYILSILFFILMLISSEKSIALVLAFPLYEIILGSIRKNWKKIIPFLAIALISVLFNFSQIGQRRVYFESTAPQDQIILNPFVQVPVAITSYLELIFWPDKLTLYHTEMIFTQLEYVIRGIVFLVFIGIMLVALKKNRFLFFWFCFLFVFLALTLTPLGITWIVAERYIYLGTLGVFVPIAWLFAKAMENKKLQAIAVLLFAIIIIALSIRTIVRNVDWYNEDNLWLAAARTSPSSSQNRNNLGDYYGRHGDLENSIKEFKKAIELKPNYADAHHNLGNAYRDMGRFDDAVMQYEKASSFNPQIWQSYQNIAAIEYQRGNFSKAEEAIEKALSIESKDANLYLIRGLILVKTGQKEEARQILQQILTIDPNNQFAQQGLIELEQGVSSSSPSATPQ